MPFFSWGKHEGCWHIVFILDLEIETLFYLEEPHKTHILFVSWNISRSFLLFDVV